MSWGWLSHVRRESSVRQMGSAAALTLIDAFLSAITPTPVKPVPPPIGSAPRSAFFHAMSRVRATAHVRQDIVRVPCEPPAGFISNF